MPLSWNEIRHRAIGFSKSWAGESSEKSEKQTFWNEFFQVFGHDRRLVATFAGTFCNPTGMKQPLYDHA